MLENGFITVEYANTILRIHKYYCLGRNILESLIIPLNNVILKILLLVLFKVHVSCY